MNIWLKRLLVSTFIIVQLWLVSITVQYPITAIIVEKNEQQQWLIKEFEKKEIPSALNLQLGDQVTSIDGQEPGQHFTVSRWSSISQFDTLTISRNGSSFEASTNALIHMDIWDYVSILGGIICFCLALIIYNKIGKFPSARLLSLIFINLSLIYISTGASSRSDGLGKLIIGTSMMTLPILFLHFFIVFFNEKGNLKLPTAFLKWLYVLPAITTVFRISFLTPVAHYFYQYNNGFILPYFLLGLLANFFVLGFIYLKYRKTNEYFSMIIKTVGVSLLISFLPFIISFIPFVIFRVFWISPLHTGWFVLLFPLSFAYLIMAKRIYDVDIILRRIKFTVLISLIPSIILVGFYALMNLKQLDYGLLIFQLVITVIVITFLLYSLEYITGKLDAIMFPRKHQLQVALKNISTKLRTIQNFRELKEIVLTDIIHTLEVLGGAVALKYKHDVDIISSGIIDEDDIRQQIANGQLDDDNYSFFEINRNEEYRSYLIMSKKRNHTLLNQEEQQWLNLIISYLAVSLENIYLIHKLHSKLHELAAQISEEPDNANVILWLRKSLFEIQEKERHRIALDLHDTTIQDIILLRRKLLAFTEQYNLSPDKKEKLEQFAYHLELVNENLRYNCFELNPHLLEQLGLIKSIERLIEMETMTNDYDILLTASSAEAIEVADIELKKHLFRITQEMLNNAKKHSQASTIRIELQAIDTHLYLTYMDDGVGFDPNPVDMQDRALALSESGLGLQQLKSRVLLVKGSCEIDSRPGTGVKIQVRVPIDRATLIA